ncbi:MAG: phage tail tape measure protein [Bacteroidetes bacterium]|nr:phage tail tape measure protein [Bacteroidota bacterium]
MSYLKTDKLQLDIIINGDESRKELMKLEGQGKQLRNELKKMTEGTDDYIKKSNELKQVEARMEGIRKEIGLTGATMKELRARQRELNMTMQNMDPRLPQYKLLHTELTQVNARMAELRGTSQATGLSMKGMADGFNRYMGIFMAATATLTGFVLGIKSAKKAFDDFNQAKANLSALTGLEGSDLEWFGQQAKKMGTETQEGGIKITKSATDILRAYTLMGSAKPELLKDKEALNEVTKQALILAEASQMETEPAVSSLANIMNQFGAGADKAAQFVNVLAAGAKEGAAEVPDLNEAILKFGAAAQVANVSVEQSVGLVEALGEKGIKGEIAGTGLKNMLIKLMSGADDTNPKIVGINTALDNLATKNLNAAEMTKLFGLENYTVAQNLVTNRKRAEELTTAITGTNVAYEMANKTTNTSKAALAQAMNRFQLLAIELGEKLTPALTAVTGWTAKLVSGTIVFIDVIKNNKGVIIGLVGAFIALNAAKVKNIGVMALQHLTLKQGIGLRIKDAILLEAGIIKEEIHAAVIGKTTIMQKAAAIATVAWQRALTLLGGPIGLAIAGLTAIATALMIYNQRTSEAQRLAELKNEIETKGLVNTAEQQVQLALLIGISKDEHRSKKDRIDAIKELNKISPEYLGNLTLENINTKAATKSVNDYTAALINQAKAQASLEKIKEIQKEILELSSNQTKEGVGFFEGAWNVLTSGGNGAIAASKNIVTAYNNTQDKLKELKNQQQVLTEEFTKKQVAATVTGEGTITTIKKDAAAQRAELEEKTDAELIELRSTSYDKLEKQLIKEILAKRKLNAKGNKDAFDAEKAYQELMIDMMQEGYDKEIAKEELKHTKNLYQFKGSNKLLELEADRHKKELDKIRTTVAKKDKKPLGPENYDYDAEIAKGRQKAIDEARKAANEARDNVDLDVKMGKLNPADANQEKLNIEMAYLGQLYLLRKRSGQDTVQIEKQMADKMRDIDEEYYKKKRKDVLEAGALQALQNAGNAKSFEEAGKLVLQGIRDTIKAYLAEAMAGMIANEFATKGIFGAITAAAGAALVNVAFETLVPSFASGNVDVIGASNGKHYRARAGVNVNSPMLVKSPTIMGSANGNPFLMGEEMPELVIDGPRTKNIMLNYPQIFDAIRSVPQYASGNVGSKETIRESMFADPRLLEAIETLNRKMDGVSLLTLRNKLKREEDKVSVVNSKFGTEVK